MTIELAKHVLLNDGTSNGSTYGVSSFSKDFGSNIEVDQSDSYQFKLRSFLTTQNLKMVVESDDGDANGSTDIKQIFKIQYLGTTTDTGAVWITHTANVCGFPGGAGTTSSNQANSINTTNIPITILYCPDKAELRKAKLVFYDNGVAKATVYLSGTGKRKTSSINWTQDFSDLETFPASQTRNIDLSTISLTPAEADVNSVIFTSSDNSVVEVQNNNQVIVRGAGTTTLTASFPQTDRLTASSTTVNVTVTDPFDFGSEYVGYATTGRQILSKYLQGITPVSVNSSNPNVFRVFTSDENTGSTALTNPLSVSGTMYVKYYPSAIGNESANITVTDANSNVVVIPVKGVAVKNDIHFTTNPLGQVETKTITLQNRAVGSGYTVAVVGTANRKMYRVNNGIASADIATNSFDLSFMAPNTNEQNGISVQVTEKSTNQVYTLYAYGQATNNTMAFSETSVSDKDNAHNYNFTISGFEENGKYEFDVRSNNTSVMTSFLIDGSSSMQDLTNGTHTLQFQPQILSQFGNTKLYARDKLNDILYPIADITASSKQKSVTMEWINTADTIVIGGVCQSGFARCVEVPGLMVYYTSSDQSIIEPCDEDANHTGYYGGVKGNALSTATVTAYILNTSEYNLPDASKISKPFRVSAKAGQTITGIADNLSYSTGTTPQTLSAKAVLSSDGTTETYMAISYAIENAASKTGVVTLSGNVLTIVGEGSAVLIVSAAGDADNYEATTKRVSIEVYRVGECATQYVVNEGSKTYPNTGTTDKVFEQTYNITKPVGKVRYMSATLSSFSNLIVTVHYVCNGQTVKLVDDKQCFSAFGENEWDLISEQDLPENTTSVYYKLYTPTASLKVSTSALQITQKKYFRDSQTATVNFGEVKYKVPDTRTGIAAMPYSALDKNEVTYEIVGPQASSFSLENSEALRNLPCDDFGVFSLDIKFTPQIIGDCSATLWLTAKVDGADVTKSITLTGKGIPQTQTIEWNQDFSYVTVADNFVDTLLTAVSSVKSEPMPVTYSIESLNSDLTPSSQTFATLIDSHGGTYLHVIGAGKVKVTASQAGKTVNDTTFISPASVYKIIDIGAAEQSIYWESWEGAPVTTKTITTAQSTTGVATTLDAHSIDKYNHNTGRIVQYSFAISNYCNNGTLAQLIDTTRNANNDLEVRYLGDGEATLTITASQPGDGKDYNPTTVNQTKTLEIKKVTPETRWTTNELADLHYGDSILMTPTTNYNVGLDTYGYTSAAITNNRARLNGNSLNIKAVSTDESITALKLEDCWNYESNSPVTRSDITFAKSTQAIVWNDILHDTIAGDYTANPIVINLSGYSVDSRHTTSLDNVDTWLTRQSNGDVLTGIDVTYTVTFTPKTSGTLDYELENNVLTIKDAPEGTVTIRANCLDNTYYTAPVEVVKSFEIKKGCLHFVATVDSAWDNPLNWDLGIVPTDINNVSIDEPCLISNTVTALCDSMLFTSDGSLTIKPNAVLDATVIKNTDATKLLLKADASNQATVLLAGGSPKATIENCFKGKLNPEAGKNNPDWQYRGFIGSNPVASGWWSSIVMFKWNERTNKTTCWNDDGVTPVNQGKSNYAGETWAGYSMANYADQYAVKTYTTELIPTKDTFHLFTLTRTESGNGSADAPNCGVNLITNSWSAPIDMSSTAISYTGNVERTFYFFNTRSHNAYVRDSVNSIITYPQKIGKYIQTTDDYIPSGQSFAVWAKTDGATMTIPSSAIASTPSYAMYMPAEAERFNILSIDIANDRSFDRVVLAENDLCTSAFDNGYDGSKMFMSGVPQIFAVNSFGRTAVNSDSTLLGQTIGCIAANDGETCTISFDTERLTGFDELYLYDRTTHRYIDILNGDTYTFNASATDDTQRFQIIGSRDDGSSYVTTDDRMIEVIANRALLSGFAGSDAMVYITDLAGNNLWSAKTADGPWFTLPVLPAGMYVIYCDGVSAKFVVK